MISEALEFWNTIAGKVKSLIKSETQNVMRCERYRVTTAPNGSKVGVTLPLGTKEIFLPYSKEVANAAVGNQVLVVWWGSMSNAKVYYYANGYNGALLASMPVGTIYESGNSTSPATLFGGTWTSLSNNISTFTPADLNNLYGGALYVTDVVVDVESISANTGSSFTYDLSDEAPFSSDMAIGVVGWGITGVAYLTVNRIKLEDNETISYLIRNLSSSDYTTGATITFQVLWQKINPPARTTVYRWKRTA